MVVDEDDPTTPSVNGIRPAEVVTGADGPARADLPWVVPVGILGTAAEWLTPIAVSSPLSDSDDLHPGAAHVDLHEAFGEAAIVLGLCRRRERRHALADAAMSLFAEWLVECGQVAPAATGENAHHLVHRWAVEQSSWTATRELSTAASVQRLRRLAAELGEAGFGALLRAEVASSTRVSGTALALLDYARSTNAEGDGTKR
ncbi:MAG: hypothetical protein JWO57_3396 [Pseudonocardiales bacterium]|jgi:hypothetical protein|nr:hypothetical protein [Pseudonocardiales bacterium]